MKLLKINNTNIPFLVLSIFVLLFYTENLTAQVNLQITPSRTSGTAPLYVFFDATSTTGLTDTNDLVNADFHWNFDQTNVDPNGDWEVIKGMVAGHVFEAAGTYIVHCTVTAPDGTTDTETVTITVAAFSGTTYYVSTSGSDANDGLSESTPWQTANFAFSQLSINEQILFNRGETFTNVDPNLNNLSGGKMIVGAYGSGNKPILLGTLDQTILHLDFVDDIVFMDLHLEVNTSTGGIDNFSIEDCSDVLLLNLEMEGSTGRAVYNDDCDLVGVFDSYIHNFGVLATFAGDGTRLSWVGNTIDSLIGTIEPEHGMRIQRGEKQFIAHNSFTNLVDTDSAIQIRGENQRHVMLYKNKMDRQLGINPTNHFSIQAISYVTIEGNYIGQNPNYTGTSRENVNNGINIEATNIAIRNNVIDGYRNAIFIGHDYSGQISGSVDVYHNTVNWRSVSPQSNTSGRIVRIREVAHVKVKNNFITAPTLAEASVINIDATSTHIWTTDNIIATTADYAVNPLPNSQADANDISNYQILSNSAAVSAGGNNIPVFYDAVGNTRNTTTPDVGVFEYQVVLPVELLSFEAIPHDDAVFLQWETATEINSDYFDIERSNNGFDFETIGQVAAAGNSIHLSEYTFIDDFPLNGINYYRLKMVDQDESFEYSNIAMIQLKTNHSIRIFPNPVNDVFYIQLNGFDNTTHFVFELYNTLGKNITIQRLTNQHQHFDISNLTNGVYYWQLKNKEIVVNKGTLVKIK